MQPRSNQLANAIVFSCALFGCALSVRIEATAAEYLGGLFLLFKHRSGEIIIRLTIFLT